MSYDVRLTWKFFLQIPGSRELAAGDSTQIFSVRTGKSLLRDVGGTVQTDFFPLVLEPIGPFFSKIAKAAKLAAIALQKTGFETTTGVFGGREELPLRGNYALRSYGEELCVSIEVSPIRMESLNDLSAAVSPPTSAPLRSFAARLAEVVGAELGVSGLRAAGLKLYPCVRIVAQPEAVSVPLARLVELLTRHTAPSLGVIEDVYAKNRDHQVDGTLVLLDRQGVICYASPTAHADERANCDRRFVSCSALLELAAAIQRLGLRRDGSALMRAARQFLADPKRAIPNSTSASRAWSVFVEEFNLSPAPYLNASNARVSAVAGSAVSVPGATVLCIAAATIELSAVHGFLERRFGSPKIVEVLRGSDFALQFRDSSRGATWYVVPLSFQGQVEAAVETKHLCGLLRPDLLLMVGMCMSMPKKSLQSGTVVIPNEVMVFDHERLTAEGVQHRPHGDRVDNGLFKLARLVAATQTFDYKVVADKGLASATSKVEDPDAELISFIEGAFPDAAAFDMEGWGFYRASSGQQCLWIKAVADAGEPQGNDAASQSTKRLTQYQVTENAIDFATRLVDNFLGLPG
jgi:nucleoside phosphorylase